MWEMKGCHFIYAARQICTNRYNIYKRNFFIFKAIYTYNNFNFTKNIFLVSVKEKSF